MNKICYKQCNIEKHKGKETVSQTAWIPEKFSKVGEIIKIKNNDNTWTDGWIVKSVGTTKLEENELPDSHKGAKNHRKNTGDALPK